MSREKETKYPDKILQDPDLYLFDQVILSGRILLKQAQFSQLLEMVQSHTWTAQAQSPLHRPHSHRSFPRPQNVPVNPERNPFQLRLNEPISLFRQSGKPRNRKMSEINTSLGSITVFRVPNTMF